MYELLKGLFDIGRVTGVFHDFVDQTHHILLYTLYFYIPVLVHIQINLSGSINQEGPSLNGGREESVVDSGEKDSGVKMKDEAIEDLVSDSLNIFMATKQSLIQSR